MVEQYPDEIKIVNIIGGGQDENGDFIPPTQTTEYLKCRFVPSGQSIKALFDGKEYVVSYKIAFPLGSKPLIIGQKVFRGDWELTVLNYEVGQLHSVAWV